MESSYAQNKRAKTCLDKRTSASAYIDQSLTTRTSTFIPPRSQESKFQLNSNLTKILEIEKERQDQELELSSQKRDHKKSEEEIQFHSFIDGFSNSAKYINEQFEELIKKSQSNIDELKNTKDRLTECERSTYRLEMNLEEKYQQFMEEEKLRKEKEERKARKRASKYKSFFTTSPFT